MVLSKFFKGKKQKDNYDWGYFLNKAIKNNWLDEFNRILDKKPEFVTKEGSFAMIKAAGLGNLEMVKSLHMRGSDVDVSAVANVINNGNKDILDFFKQKNIDFTEGQKMSDLINAKQKRRAEARKQMKKTWF